MKKQPPLLRSRTNNKMVDIKLERYKPRDWDYQSPKHQLRPQFVLGRSKKRAKNLSPKEFKIFKELTAKEKLSNDDEFYIRELKPAIYRSYILSQIATLPGAVLVEENKINDDQHRKDRIKVVRNNNLCYLNKLKNDYTSNVAFLPGSRDKEIKKEIFIKGKSCADFRINKIKKEEEKQNLKKEKVLSPQRDRIKRKEKIKKNK